MALSMETKQFRVSVSAPGGRTEGAPDWRTGAGVQLRVGEVAVECKEAEKRN